MHTTLAVRHLICQTYPCKQTTKRRPGVQPKEHDRLANGAGKALEQQGAVLYSPLLLQSAIRGVGAEASASTIRVMTYIG